MIEKIVSISEIQRELTELPTYFEQGLKVVTVTRDEKPIMTILPFETHRRLKEIIKALQEKVDFPEETLETSQDEK